jgi:hypothetical protein
MRNRKLYLNCLRVTAETYRLGTSQGKSREEILRIMQAEGYNLAPLREPAGV